MPSSIPASITSFRINISDAAVRRPVLAIEASRIFALWANVELMFGCMASMLIGDQLALTFLDNLKSKNQRFDGIRKAAEDRIDHSETKQLLHPVLKLLDKAAEPRNELAHCQWGTIDDLPDALLLTKPAVAIRFARANILSQATTIVTAPTECKLDMEMNTKHSVSYAEEMIEALRSGTQVWRHADFERPLFLATHAVVALTSYSIAITQPESAEADQARRQLRDLLKETEQHY